MNTHRCKESLKQQVSIRYDKEFDFVMGTDEKDWHMMRLVVDYEYCSKYLGRPIKVKYCPFCGKELSCDYIDGFVDVKDVTIGDKNYFKGIRLY